MSNIDFTKSIFMQQLIIWIDYDQDETSKLIRLTTELKPTWFELFILYYLRDIKWSHNIYHSWKTGKPDWWIDIFWDVYAQVKKYQISTKYQKWVNLSQVRDFYGAVMKEEFTKKNIVNKNEISEMIFITTWRFADPAIKFCDQVNIKHWDYSYIIERVIKHWYDLEWFSNKIPENEKKNVFNDYQPTLLWADEKINKNDFLNDDIEFIYKEISYKIHNIKRQRWEKYIFKDQYYCKSLVENRILSLEEYHKAYSNLTISEKEIIDNHGDIFAKVLKKIQEHTF